MKKAVIFDMNGVLVLSPKLSDRFKESFGISPEDFLPALKDTVAQARKPGAGSLYSYWQPYLQKWGVPLDEKGLYDFWFNAEHESLEMIAVLRELKDKGIKLFVLSNNFKERSAYYEDNMTFLKELIDGQYYSWKTGVIKPDLRAFQIILDDHKLKPEEVAYFDDREDNIAAARSLGIDGHIFDNPTQVRQIVLQ